MKKLNKNILNGMYRTLYVNGCSWTSGNEIECDIKFIEYLNNNNLKISKTNNWSIVNEKNVHVANISDLWNEFNWSGIISKKLNIQNLINESVGGGSNDRIFRMTYDFLLKYPKEKRNELLLIIGWTCSDRREIYLEQIDSWERFNPTYSFTETLDYTKSNIDKNYKIELDNLHKDFIMLLHNDYECTHRYFQQVYYLSNLLENLNIKYVFFNSFSPYGGGLKNDIIKNKFINDVEWYDNNENIINQTMMEFVLKNEYPVAPFKHPMIDAHYNWAIFLMNYLQKIYKK